MSRTSRAPDREHIFRSLYKAVYPDLLRFVQRRADPHYAEDMVADAFLVVWRRLDELPRTHERARAWIFGIARNILLNHYRGAERRRALGVRLANATTYRSADPAAEGVISQVDLAKAWHRLSEIHQEVLALAVFEELNSRHAAAVLGISPVAFRLRLSRARRALQLHLDDLSNQTATSTRNTSERSTKP